MALASTTEQLTSEDFDESIKCWRSNKVYITSKGLWMYKTNSDSPLELREYRSKTPKHPNAETWRECGYTSSRGEVCTNLCENCTDDSELYTNVQFCSVHKRYATKEYQRRIRTVKDIFHEQMQNPATVERLRELYNTPHLLGDMV
jgi:hypothetical protein